ncbi:MAG TPA: phytoene desaturase family protein [Cyclobacteriaceae bacterium]|nr:phytoene desaturase family protein [Cyclobacteriaceae bacterium]
MKKIAVIGSGFAGISAATALAAEGFDVTVYEKNDSAGGRARKFESNGFVFDMGPSWYWMPDVFERYFNRFDKSVSDYYHLERLSPSYRIFFNENDVWDLPSKLEDLYQFFEMEEKGSSLQLKKFLDEAAYKYKVGIEDLVYKPGLSIMELMDPMLMKGVFKLHVLQSISTYIRKYFKSSRLIQLLEFPVLFLGAAPSDTPALYSLMNYADMVLGTWYPIGGMNKIVEAMVTLAEEKGVKFEFNSNVQSLNMSSTKVNSITIDGHDKPVDHVIAGADYHHVEQELLPEKFRKYNEGYWESRKLAPSSLIFYLGVNKRLDHLLHHNLFFDEDFALHTKEIYQNPSWPTNPLFYVCCPSKTDSSVAPEGYENLFILIPVASGLEDEETTREKYFEIVINRIEKLTGQSIATNIVYKRSYAHRDFIENYNSYKGNAYGLANTITQTANLKPSIVNKKVSNLFYTGQLTVPGPGVPPSLISGQVVAQELIKREKRKTN